MSDAFWLTALAALLAYMLGSIPFGYVIARVVAGIDIRQHGSGNIGATNVGRVLGAKWGLLALALDLIKGLLPVWLLPVLLLPPDVPPLPVEVLCGVATIVGHMYPCWLWLRGGKGVATALGVVLYLSPWVSAIAFGVFVASFAIWRIVSLSSMLAALAFAAAAMAWAAPAPFSAARWSLSTFSLAVPALIILRHRSNIGRLLRHEEPRYAFGKREAK